MVFLGGQPGAGKSRATDILKNLHSAEDLVAIEGDAYRRHHPDYEATLRTDPTAMPEVTAPAAGAWTGMAVQTAVANGYSALVEGTWRDVNMPLTTARRVHDLRWHTHAAVVAVPAALSLVGTVSRFYDADPLRARWTPVEAHDLTVRALPDSVRELAGASEIDRFTVLDRDGHVHLDEDGADLPGRAERAAASYAQLTTRPLTEHELSSILQTLTRALDDHRWGSSAWPWRWCSPSSCYSRRGRGSECNPCFMKPPSVPYGWHLSVIPRGVVVGSRSTKTLH